MRKNTRIAFRILGVFALILFYTSVIAQNGHWFRESVKENKTDLTAQKAKCLPKCSFSGTSKDLGMNFEFSYYSDVDKKHHSYKGQSSWTWSSTEAISSLLPGQKITIRMIINNLSSENSGVTGYAMFGNWGFMKPESGKSGDETAKPNGSAIMVGTFEVPKSPGYNKDGSLNPYLRLTFLLSGGNEQRYIERIYTYKWTQATVQPPGNDVIQGNWNTQANHLRGKNGQRFTFYFPPNGTLSNRCWGTNVYTDDGSVATCAVHAGLITKEKGGTVTIEIRAGQTSYQGSSRNGVTSGNWGAFDGSFTFVNNGTVYQPPVSNTVQGTWVMQADSYRGQIGKRVTFYFPPGGTISGRCWGTDVYTDDGSIATAAVHAGLITAKNGGTVTIEIRAGQPSYQGSTRNGVTSKNWGAFTGSFVFIR